MYPRLGEIIIDVDGLLRIALLHVVARNRQGRPRGGVLGQPEVRRLRFRRGRLRGRVLVAIADLVDDTPARAVPAELAASRTEK